MQSNDSLRELNAKLLTEIAKLRKENTKIPELREKLLRFAEIEAENARLKQIIEENVKRDVRVEELEQRIKSLRPDSFITSENSSDLTSDSGTYQEKNSRSSTSSITIKTTSSEEKKINDFLDSVHKETVSEKIREKNREKKLQRETTTQELSDDKKTTFSENDNQNSNLSCDMKTVPSGNDQVSNLSCKTKTISSRNNQTEISELEQDDNTISTEINILNNKGRAQHLSNLFKTVIKSRQQEILNWYYYSLEFENRIHVITTDELENFLWLFGENGVGIDKIKLITYSANEISKLADVQIQNIIDQEPFPRNQEIDRDSDPSEVKIQVSASDNSRSGDAIASEDSNYEYDFEDPFDNNEDDSRSEDANATRDNENDEEFFNNNEYDNDEGGFCGFFDDDEEGYYYDLNTGETYTKSDRSIYAY
ncbi:5413_t:CDS:2 [Paraglomus brasilianum]|uniref:5413_t:CDS:1 n=1 Tax=Paraglomus brasilianum TaxID=144538 RepID=A0A9N9B8J3_9GLOM|nr:5413_t:CDS:2 [Paraglomus brasilianum]